MSQNTSQSLPIPSRPMTEKDLSLFNDPRWDSARQNMTNEQIEHYETIGDQMNGSIDFTSGESNPIPIPEPIESSLAYIEMGLRSGLDPEDLGSDEIELLEKFCGKNWKKVFGLEPGHNNENCHQGDAKE